MTCWGDEHEYLLAMVDELGLETITSLVEEARLNPALRAHRKRPHDILLSDIVSILASREDKQVAERKQVAQQIVDEQRQAAERRRQMDHDAALAKKVGAAATASCGYGLSAYELAIEQLARCGIKR